MKNHRKFKRSPLALAVLALLSEAPMHPYRMQQLIKKRGLGEVINVRLRASIYQTIERLLRCGLIAVRETSREAGRPDRTVYEATETGRAMLREWMRDILAVPLQEFPEFPAALSFLATVEPDDARRCLEERQTALESELERIDAVLHRNRNRVPRLFMLELEYKRAVTDAELGWVRSILEELRSGELYWDKAWLREVGKKLADPELGG
jgi:DNA-binding PadR family transcriptional regulator